MSESNPSDPKYKKVGDLSKKEEGGLAGRETFSSSDDHHDLPESSALSVKTQEAAKRSFIYSVSNGRIPAAMEIKNRFFLPDSFISSEEVAEAIKKRFAAELLVQGDYSAALETKNAYNLSEEVVQPIVTRELISRLSKGWVEDAVAIKRLFALPESLVLSAEVREVATQGFDQVLHRLPRIAFAIKDAFLLPEEIVQQKAKQAFIDYLLMGQLYSASLVKETFSLPESVVSSAEVQEAIRPEFIRYLSKGETDVAIRIKNEFSIDISSQSILDQFPNVKELLGVK